MNAYYSILKISPNPYLDDQLSLGLIIFSDSYVWFRYETELLRYLKPFLKNSFSGIEKMLKMMSRKIASLESHQLDLYNSIGPYFEKRLYENLALSQSGILRFSNPIPIAIPTTTEEGFNNIAIGILGDWRVEKTHLVNHEKNRIDQKLLIPLSDFIHTNVVLNSKHIQALYYRYPIDAIGMGENIYVIKYLNFKQTPQTLERKVMRLLYLLELMEKQYQKHIRTFIIGSIPPQRSRSKGYIYNLIISQPNLQFIQPEDVLQILKLLQSENVRKIWT